MHFEQKVRQICTIFRILFKFFHIQADIYLLGFKPKISNANVEIKSIETDITDFVFDNGELPDSLADIGKDGLTDP